MKRSLVTTTLVAVGALALLSGFTRCGHRRAPDPERIARHIDHHVEDFVDDIDADKSQAKQIQALADRVKGHLPGLLEGHQAMKKDLRTNWAAESPDGPALHRALDQQLGRVSGALHELLDVGIGLHQVLTPEQRAEVQARWE